MNHAKLYIGNVLCGEILTDGLIYSENNWVTVNCQLTGSFIRLV